LGEIDSVAIELDVFDSLFPADPYDVLQIIAQCWFSTGDLDCVTGDGPLCPECFDHLANNVLRGLVDIGSFNAFLGIEEAVPTGEIASIRYD
jgi:hypothetical protein